MLEYDDWRSKTVQSMLEGHRRVLQEHHQRGGRRLSQSELVDLERKIKVYSRHLERLASETEEQKREKVREYNDMSANMYRKDHIDFGKTGI